MYYMDVFVHARAVNAHTDRHIYTHAHTHTHLHAIFALEKFRTLIDSRDAGQMMAAVVFGLVIVR